MTRAVLFDIDGTLLDTNEFVYQAFEYALKTYSLRSVSRKDMRPLMGKSLEYIYSQLDPSHVPDLFIGAHRSFQTKNFHLSHPFPGTAHTLEKLQKAGIKLAAVTTRSNLTSVGTLERAGIRNFFDAVISAEDVKNIKPDPEPLLKALQILNELPADAYMVGDSSVDIQAGKNANVKTVAVSYGFHRDTISDSNPDYLVDAIEEILPIIFQEKL